MTPDPEPQPEPDSTPHKVLAWNAKVGRNHDDVLDGLSTLISNNDPDVVCLQEFSGYMGDLRNRFGKAWWIYAHDEWDESNMNPVMVTKDGYSQKTRGQKDGWDTLRTTTDWVGPQGGTHHGRTWTWVKVSGLWVLSLHRCTGGETKNSESFIEEYDKLVKWITNHTPCLVIGDHNCGKNATFPGASRLIAETVGGSISGSPDANIDYAVKKDVKGTLTVKGSQGSDHKAVLWTRS